MASNTETRNETGQNQEQQGQTLQGSAPSSAGQQQNQQRNQVQQRSRTGVAPYASSPFSMLQRLSQEMDELMESLFYGGGQARRQGRQDQLTPLWVPDVEVREQDNKLQIRVDLPGVPKENVRVDLQEGMVVIEGERREERTEGDEQRGWRRTERRYGSFYRAIPLPEGAEVEKAEARMKDGVLELTVPLSEEKNPRRLDIKD
jgi:HSP20 family protein